MCIAGKLQIKIFNCYTADVLTRPLVVVVAQVLVIFIQGHSLSAEVDTQKHGRAAGGSSQRILVLSALSDPVAVEEVCCIVGALSTFGAAVILLFWVYSG